MFKVPWPNVARLINTQRQILGFKLEVKKPKLPGIDSDLRLSPKWRFCLGEASEWDCVWKLSPHILYSSLGLGLKMCTTTAQLLWQTSVATGIKSLCYHCLVYKADQGFYSLMFRLAIFINVQVRYNCMCVKIFFHLCSSGKLACNFWEIFVHLYMCVYVCVY